MSEGGMEPDDPGGGHTRPPEPTEPKNSKITEKETNLNENNETNLIGNNEKLNENQSQIDLNLNKHDENEKQTNSNENNEINKENETNSNNDNEETNENDINSNENETNETNKDLTNNDDHNEKLNENNMNSNENDTDETNQDLTNNDNERINENDINSNENDTNETNEELTNNNRYESDQNHNNENEKPWQIFKNKRSEKRNKKQQRNQERRFREIEAYEELFNRPETYYDKYFVLRFPSIQYIDMLNPILAERDLERQVGKLGNVHKNGVNSLLVQATGSHQSNRIKNIKKVLKFNVIIETHKLLNTTKGVVKSRHMSDCSIEELKEVLKDQKVSDIVRINIKKDGILTPIDTYILTFQTNTLPTKLKLSSWYAIDVKEYIERPRQCYNCQKFGHSGKHCRQKDEKTCSKCSQKGHIKNDCTETEFCCLNCKEKHPSTSKDCIKYQVEAEILKLQLKHKIPRPKAQTLCLEANPDIKYLYEKPKRSYQNNQEEQNEDPMQPTHSRSQIPPNNKNLREPSQAEQQTTEAAITDEPQNNKQQTPKNIKNTITNPQQNTKQKTPTPTQKITINRRNPIPPPQNSSTTTQNHTEAKTSAIKTFIRKQEQKNQNMNKQTINISNTGKRTSDDANQSLEDIAKQMSEITPKSKIRKTINQKAKQPPNKQTNKPKN